MCVRNVHGGRLRASFSLFFVVVVVVACTSAPSATYAGVRTYCNVCTLGPIIHAFVGARARDSDLFLSRLINEEIKVSASQSRHKDTGRGIRHPAATSEILISPSLYFPLRGHTALWLSLRSAELSVLFAMTWAIRRRCGVGRLAQSVNKLLIIFHCAASLPHRIQHSDEEPTPSYMSHWPKKDSKVFDSVTPSHGVYRNPYWH